MERLSPPAADLIHPFGPVYIDGLKTTVNHITRKGTHAGRFCPGRPIQLQLPGELQSSTLTAP